MLSVKQDLLEVVMSKTMRTRLLLLLVILVCLLIIGSTINRIIARNPPDNIPDRTAAFAEVFDILYGMYPEANMGASAVVLCLNDLNKSDYDCAVDGIGAYCRTNGIKLSYSSYGESPDNATLLDEENLIFTFERVRYPCLLSGNIRVTFLVQKYRPGATGFALNVSCDWKLDAWDCYWTGSQEITASNV